MHYRIMILERMLAITIIALIATVSIAGYAVYRYNTRIDRLEKLACGFEQFEDLSVRAQTLDSARWSCYYGRG